MKKITYLCTTGLVASTLAHASMDTDIAAAVSNKAASVKTAEKMRSPVAYSAEDNSSYSKKNNSNSSPVNVLLEGLVSYYYPTSNQFRKSFTGAGMYGLELSVQAYKGLYAWTNANILVHDGHSSGIASKSELIFVPIGVGLKYFWKVDFTNFYVGAGAVPAYVHTHNTSGFVEKNVSKWGCGGVAKAGILFDLPESFFIDVFANYTYLRIANHDSFPGVYTSSADLSGITMGVGIGYRFK